MVDLTGEPVKDAAAAQAPRARTRTWLWIGLGAAALVAINVGLTLVLTHRAAAPAPAKQAAAPAPRPQHNAIFYPLDPAFVVNFKDGDAIRFLQISVEVMTYDASVVDMIKRYSPIIRNNLLLLFSSQSYKTLSTRRAKEKLQTETRDEIEKVLQANAGRGGVEAVYFTSFVMQ